MAIDFADAWSEWFRAIKDRCPDYLVTIARRDARQWKSEGRGQYKCCSPLRVDQKPSFQIYANGTWHDWSTHESGDLISYIQLRDHVDCKAAMNILAAEMNLLSWEETLAALGSGGGPRATAAELLALWHQEEERRAVRQVLHDLVHLCHDLLPSRVRAHLQDHYGFSDETIDFEKLGWVPAGLYDLGLAMGHTREALVQTGLFFDRAGADPEPIAVHRILFPYWKDGMVEYAALRAYGSAPTPPTEDEVARGERDPEEFERHRKQFHDQKYKKLLVHSDKFSYVSPTIANSTLWGEDSLRQVRPDVTPLLIEGAPDVLIARQIGFPVCLSPITTSPSNAQLQRIVKWARGWKEIVVLNDNEANRSGAKGAIRVGKALWKEGILVRIATLPRAEGLTKVDVNEYVRSIVRPQVENGVSQDEAEAAAHAAITAVVEAAQPLLDFLIADLTPETEDLDERMRELGTLAQRLEPIARENFLEQKIIKGRLKKASAGEKKAYRAAFGEAAKAIAKAKKEEEKPAAAAAPEPAPPSVAPPATEAAAWDDLTPDTPPTAADARTHAAEIAHALPDPPLYLTPTATTVVQRDGTYERETTEGRVRISNFALQLLRIIVHHDGPGTYVCRVLGPTNKTVIKEWRIPHAAWSGKRHFFEHFPSEKMMWTGTDDEVQIVRERIIGLGDTVPRVQEVSTLGLHEVDGAARFVLIAGTLNAQGQWMDTPDLAFVPTTHTAMQAKLARTRGGTMPTALTREVWPLLATCYASHTAHALIAWFASCPFKPRLQEKLGSFPILNVYGTAGSGKSSLLQHIFLPAFGGIQPRESLISCDQSKFIFTSECSTANAIPIVFDEYKPNEMKPTVVNDLHRLIKGIYCGETRMIGNLDRNRIFQVNAPLCIGGETKLESDPAIVERCIFVPLDKNWVRSHPDASAVFFHLRTLPLHTIAVQFQAWSLQADMDTLFARAEREEVEVRTLLTYDARVRANVVCALFGLAVYETFAGVLGVSVPAIARGSFIQTVVRETLEESGDGSGHALDALDHLVMDAGVMANGGVLQEGVDYAFFEKEKRGQKEKQLFLYLDGIEAKRAAWKRAQGVTLQSPGLAGLRRIAVEKLAQGGSYVLERCRARLAGDGHVRGFSFDHDKIIAMGWDEFPCIQIRGAGGARVKGQKIIVFADSATEALQAAKEWKNN